MPNTGRCGVAGMPSSQSLTSCPASLSVSTSDNELALPGLAKSGSDRGGTTTPAHAPPNRPGQCLFIRRMARVLCLKTMASSVTSWVNCCKYLPALRVNKSWRRCCIEASGDRGQTRPLIRNNIVHALALSAMHEGWASRLTQRF